MLYIHALALGGKMGIFAKLLVLLICAGLYLTFHLQLQPLPSSTYLLPEPPAAADEPVFQQTWVSSEETDEAHSASIALLNTGQPVAVWYGGTEEGHVIRVAHERITDASLLYQHARKPSLFGCSADRDTTRSRSYNDHVVLLSHVG